MTPRKIKLLERYPLLHDIGISFERLPAYEHYDKHERSEHVHDIVEMSFLVEGEARHELEDQVFEERDGSLGIVHIGEKHIVLTKTESIDAINIYLHPECYKVPSLPGELRHYLPMILPLHKDFKHRRNRMIHLQFDDPKPVKDILVRLCHEQKNQATGFRETMCELFRIFLIDCARELSKTPDLDLGEELGPTAKRMEELRIYIDRHYRQKLTLEELASRSNLNKNYLCKTFKDHTGKSVLDYILQRRIHMAMISLQSSEDKILGIAHECGFQDLRHFNRKFKSLVGSSPSTFRKMKRED